MTKPKVQVFQKPAPSQSQEPFKQESFSTFSEHEIRARAYEIYESGDRTNNHPEEDWSQAETELMEMVGGK